jgi:hypothetical protein
MEFITEDAKVKQRVFTKVIKMLSWMAWVQRPSGPIKSGIKCR